MRYERSTASLGKHLTKSSSSLDEHHLQFRLVLNGLDAIPLKKWNEDLLRGFIARRRQYAAASKAKQHTLASAITAFLLLRKYGVSWHVSLEGAEANSGGVFIYLADEL